MLSLLNLDKIAHPKDGDIDFSPSQAINSSPLEATAAHRLKETIFKTFGSLIRPNLAGKELRPLEINQSPGQTIPGTSTRKRDKSSSSEEVLGTRQDLIPSVSLTGRPKNGGKSIPSQKTLLPGNVHITRVNWPTPILFFSEENQPTASTLMTFGSLTSKQKSGKKFLLLRR